MFCLNCGTDECVTYCETCDLNYCSNDCPEDHEHGGDTVSNWVCPHCGAPHYTQCTESMLWTDQAAGHSQIPAVSPPPRNQPDDHECWKCRKSFTNLVYLYRQPGSINLHARRTNRP